MGHRRSAPQAQLNFENPHAEPGDDPDTIYFRRTGDGGVALSCGDMHLCFGNADIVRAARMLLEEAGYGYCGIIRATALGFCEVDDDETADDVQRINAEHERQRREEAAFDQSWHDAHDHCDRPIDRKREAAAERQRRRRERLKAQRDKPKDRHTSNVTHDHGVTLQRDSAAECHAEMVTLTPNHRAREEAFAR